MPKERLTDLIPRRWMIGGILVVGVLTLLAALVPMEYGPVEMVVSALVTWSILLGPPLVIRLTYGSRFGTASAAMICVALYFAYFIVFELLGSVNKSHFPILVGTFAAFYILRRERVVVEEGDIDVDFTGRVSQHIASLKESTKPWVDRSLLDVEFKKKLVLIAVSAALVALGYYFFSPYETCLRKFQTVTWRVIERCSDSTDW